MIGNFVRDLTWRWDLMKWLTGYVETLVYIQSRVKTKIIYNSVRAHVLNHNWKLAFDEYAHELSQSKDPDEREMSKRMDNGWD